MIDDKLLKIFLIEMLLLGKKPEWRSGHGNGNIIKNGKITIFFLFSDPGYF